jgi:hypothetical protein
MAQVGRPPKFQSVEMIQPAIETYFADTPEEEWTITGLALALDFTSRRQLIEYAERPEFHNTIKKAKLMVERAYEKSLRKHGRSGDIFALKNFDWTDRTETDITSAGEKLGAGLSAEQAEQLIRARTNRGDL